MGIISSLFGKKPEVPEAALSPIEFSKHFFAEPNTSGDVWEIRALAMLVDFTSKRVWDCWKREDAVALMSRLDPYMDELIAVRNMRPKDDEYITVETARKCVEIADAKAKEFCNKEPCDTGASAGAASVGDVICETFGVLRGMPK